MPTQPWMEQDFVMDLYVNICKDTAQPVQKDGAEYLLTAIKKSPQDALYLRNLGIGYQTSIQLAKRLEDVSVPVIDLFDNQIKDIGLIQFVHYSERNEALKKLNVGRNDIGPDGIAALSESLQAKLNLEVLELGIPGGKHFLKPSSLAVSSRTNRITEKGAIALANALSKNKKLRYLGLSSTNFCDDGGQETVMGHFGQMFAINQTLVAIDLSNNNLGNFGITALLKGLTQNYSLQQLDISNNNITSQCMPLLSALLRQDTCHITALNLANNQLSPTGAKSLAFGLMGNRSLQLLNLENCDLRDEGVAIICEILSRPLPDPESNNNENFNENLASVTGVRERFDHSQQIFDTMERINKDMQVQLAEKEIIIVDHQNNIIKNVKLTRENLNSSVNKIEQTLMMSQKLAEPSNSPTTSSQLVKEHQFVSSKLLGGVEMSGIETLNLSGNGFGPKAFQYLNKMLKSPIVIKHLNISNNKIGSECILQLAQTIIKDQYDLRQVIFAPRSLHTVEHPEAITTPLQTINLANTNITDDAFIALCFAVSQLKEIASVSVSNNFIGDVGGQLGIRFLLGLETLTNFNVKNNQINYSTINQLNQVLEINREKVLQNGPNIIQRQNQLKRQQLQVLPAKQDELEFMVKTNELLQAYVGKIVTETDEHQANSFKVFDNLRLQCEGAVQSTELGQEKVARATENREKTQAELDGKKQQLAKMLDEDMQELRDTEGAAREKEAEYERLLENKNEIMNTQRAQIREVEAQIAKIYENQKQAGKTVDMLRMRYKDVVDRVARSPVVNQLCYSMEYADALPVLTRQMQVCQKDQTELPEVSGYDFERASQAGVVERTAKKAAGAKKKGKK